MQVLANDWMLTAPGAQDYAEVYRSLRDDLRAATIATMLETPGFERFVSLTLNSEEPGTVYARHWAGIEAALAGDWSVHATSIRTMAPLCARLGVSLVDWRTLMRSTGTVVRDALFARYGAEPARLKPTIALLHHFYDHAFDTFTEAYVKASQEQLQQSEALFQLSTIAHLLIDATGKFFKANDAFYALYGIPEGTLTSRTLASLYEPDEFARVQRDVRASSITTGRASYDCVHVRNDGTRFPAHVEAVQLSRSRQASALWALSIYDLTERQQVEALRARGRELEAENERVRAANRVKSELLANMSHELRTPLNAILGFSELLCSGEVGPLSEQQNEFLQDIHSSGKHLLRLVSDVLDLAKVESGKLSFHPELVDLAVLTREAAQISRLAASARNIVIETHVDATLGEALLDADRYRQVLYNYLSNAIKFSSPGGLVSIVLAPEGSESFRLSVVDRGIGIAAADLDRLFLHFEQLDGGRAKRHAGTGLGLILTKRLVEAQGGTVSVVSEVGLGSTFSAVLPRNPSTDSAGSRYRAGR